MLKPKLRLKHIHIQRNPLHKFQSIRSKRPPRLRNTLQNDLSTTGTCFNITANNITIDGAGYSITGDGDSASDYGITTPADADLVNLTIKNFGNITKFGRGIYLDRVNDSLIVNNIMSSTIAQTTYAVYLQDGDSNVVANNSIDWNATGSSKNSYGVYLYTGSGSYGNNNVTNNNLTINSASSYAYGLYLSNLDTSNSNTVQSNTFDVDSISSSAYGIYLINFGTSNSNTFQSNTFNLNASSDASGIYLYTRYSNSMDSNTIQSNTLNVDGSSASGITLFSYFGTSMDSNTIQSNTLNVDSAASQVYGIRMVVQTGGTSNSNTLYNNTIDAISTISISALRAYGVFLFNVDSSNVSLLTINATAPNAWAADIYLDYGADDNTFNNNILKGEDYGIYLYGSDRNNFTNENISNSGMNAVYVLSNSNNNRFFNMSIDVAVTAFNITSNDNSFINNTITNSPLDYLITGATVGEYGLIGNSLEFENSNGGVKFLNTSLTASGSNLSSVISVTSNNVFVNSTKEPGFNTTANITLNGIVSTKAQALVDFDDDGSSVICPSDICANLSYGGGVFVFNVTHFTSFSSQEFNVAPDDPTAVLLSTLSSNITSGDLNCNSLITDSDGDNMTVFLDWYLNGALNSSISYTDQPNGTSFSGVLSSGNTTKNQNWSCAMKLYDGALYSGWSNSSNLTILNAAPAVTLSAPPDGSDSKDRSPVFNWTSSDADGDTMTYEINISRRGGSDDCTDLDRISIGLSVANYTPSPDLACLHDNGNYYVWKVRADDGVVNGSWTSEWIINISSTVGILLSPSEIYFGQLGIGESNSTEEGLTPFRLENNGTVLLNISVNASSLWTSVTSDSSYYQFKADNVSGEEGSFDEAGSKTGWFNMPLTGYIVAINKLNYSDAKDSAEVDINLTLPNNEDPGMKSSTIVFKSELAE